MNLQATIDELRSMKLTAMADNYLAQREDPGMQNLSFDERFALLVSIEYNRRRKAHLFFPQNHHLAASIDKLAT